MLGRVPCGWKEDTRMLTWKARDRNEEKEMSLMVESGCCSAPSRSRVVCDGSIVVVDSDNVSTGPMLGQQLASGLVLTMFLLSARKDGQKFHAAPTSRNRALVNGRW